MTNQPSLSAPDFALPTRVAILLFDEIEVLDFAGPFEVFGVARRITGEPAFTVVTVALEAGAVTARNGLTIMPSCTVATLGPVDILIVPGGYGTRRLLSDTATLDFIRETSAAVDFTLSVCTGALLLASAGMLDGQSATTHWAALDELRALAPNTTILPHARIVDNGQLIMSAGVSAGIDAALYIVARLLGKERADHTARYMDYDGGYLGVSSRTAVIR